MQPSENLFALTKAMFKSAWDQRGKQMQAAVASVKRDLAKLDKQIDGLLDRIVDAESPAVIKAYEKRLAQFERDKIALQEKQASGLPAQAKFDELFELASTFLANPWKLWDSGNLTLRRTVLKLSFAERIAYCRKTGLRAPKTTLPFKVLGDIINQKCDMADRQGFEPWRRSPAYTLSRRAPSTTRPPVHGVMFSPYCLANASVKTKRLTF